MSIVGFGDICEDGTEVVGEIAPSTDLFFDATPVTLAEPAMFVRAVSGLSSQFAICKGGYTDTAYVVKATGTIVALIGGTFGNSCVGIQITGTSVRCVWQDTLGTYRTQLFNAALVSLGASVQTAVPASVVGTVEGFLDLTDAGVPIWTATSRTITVKGVPLIFPVNRGQFYIGQLATSAADQIVAVNAVTGKRGTLYEGLGFEPHAAITDGGDTITAAFRTLGTTGVQFVSFDVLSLPPFTGIVVGGGPSAGAAAAGLTENFGEFYPPIPQPVVERQNGLLSVPWVQWALKVARKLALPVDINSVTGVLGPDNGGVNPTPSGSNNFAPATATYLTEDDETAALPNSRQLIAGTNITFDVTTPGELEISSTAATAECYIPMTTGAIPGAILFIGGDVMLIKVPVV